MNGLNVMLRALTIFHEIQPPTYIRHYSVVIRAIIKVLIRWSLEVSIASHLSHESFHICLICKPRIARKRKCIFSLRSDDWKHVCIRRLATNDNPG